MAESLRKAQESKGNLNFVGKSAFDVLEPFVEIEQNNAKHSGQLSRFSNVVLKSDCQQVDDNVAQILGKFGIRTMRELVDLLVANYGFYKVSYQGAKKLDKHIMAVEAVDGILIRRCQHCRGVSLTNVLFHVSLYQKERTEVQQQLKRITYRKKRRPAGEPDKIAAEILTLISGPTVEVEETRARLEDALKETDEIKEGQAELKEILENKNNEITDLQKKIIELEETLVKINLTKVVASEKNEELDQRINRREAKIAKLKEEKRKLQAQLQEKDDAIKDLQLNKKQMENEHKHYVKQLMENHHIEKVTAVQIHREETDLKNETIQKAHGTLKKLQIHLEKKDSLIQKLRNADGVVESAETRITAKNDSGSGRSLTSLEQLPKSHPQNYSIIGGYKLDRFPNIT